MPLIGDLFMAESLRPRHRARLVLQNIEVMFQVENLMTAPITALMLRHALVVVVDFHP